MNRVTFLVDGFNLYHSIRDLGRFEKLHVKWLNIHSLCSSFLYLLSKEANLVEIYYFSALAYHLNDPDATKRHQDFIECLKSTGIIPEMGRFKPKKVNCPLGGKFIKHEEKETDIAIAAKLFEVIFNNKCDTVVILTGDTDIIPAIKACKSLFPNKTILCAFPYRRFNQELKVLLPVSFRIHAKAYVRHLFPDPVRLPDGSEIHKPTSW